MSFSVPRTVAERVEAVDARRISFPPPKILQVCVGQAKNWEQHPPLKFAKLPDNFAHFNA